MKELWKNIIGYEGKYQVSNLGRIKSLSRIRDWERIPGKKYQYIQKVSKEKILKLIKKSSGYYQCTLSKRKEQKIFLVHRLVGQAFISNSFSKPQINHKDGNGLNNNVKNLEWCTASENGFHSFRVLGHVAWQKGKRGENMPTSKPVLQKTLDGKLVKRWGCGLDAVRKDMFESSGISRCASGFIKTHRGFNWEYEKN